MVKGAVSGAVTREPFPSDCAASVIDDESGRRDAASITWRVDPRGVVARMKSNISAALAGCGLPLCLHANAAARAIAMAPA